MASLWPTGTPPGSRAASREGQRESGSRVKSSNSERKTGKDRGGADAEDEEDGFEWDDGREGAAKKQVAVNTDELSDDEEYNKKKKKPPAQDTKPKKKKKEWISGYETKEGRFLIGKWIREAFLYLLFLVAFTYTQLMGRNSERINSYSKMWRTILEQRSSNVTDRTSAMSFLDDFVVDEFFVPDYFENQFYSPVGNTGSPFGSALLGPAKVRQLRVKAVLCHSLHSKLFDQGLIKSEECYPSWPGASEELGFTKAAAQPVEGMANYAFLQYSDADKTQETKFEGRYGEYHGGGYVAELTQENAAQLVKDMKDVIFFDPKTRVVFFEYIAYSPNDDIFASCRVVMEFLPGGIVVPTVTVYGFLLDRYPSGTSVKIGLELFVYCMVVVYVLQEYRCYQHEGLQRYFSKLDWVQLDVVNYAMFLAGAYYKAMYLRTFMNQLDADSQREPAQMTSEIRNIALSLEFQDRLSGANGFLLWLKLCKYVLVTRRLLRLGHTIMASFAEVMTFGFLFAIIAYAFAVGGHLLFAGELGATSIFVSYYEFGTINSSARTMLRAVFGESLFKRLIAAAGLSGYMYLITWLIVSNTILLNVVISIMYEAYQSVLLKEITEPSLTTHMKIMNEWEQRKLDAEKLAEEMEANSPSQKRKDKIQGMVLTREDHHADTKGRLGWSVPTEEQHWAPYGTHGASPNKPKKQKSFL